MNSKPADIRFWAKVQKSGPNDCWNWTASKLPHGYGIFSWNGRQGLAHRYSCEVATGRTLQRHEYVLHSCDNPSCVNPAHLRVGTQGDNIQDSWDRKRRVGRDISGPNAIWLTHPESRRTGTAVNTNILTEDQVREVWRRTLAGEGAAEIAADLGVKKVTIHAIANGRTWRYLAGAPSVEALLKGGKRQVIKMTPENCEAAMAMLRNGQSVSSVARHFGVSTSPISNLKNHGKTWVPKS